MADDEFKVKDPSKAAVIDRMASDLKAAEDQRIMRIMTKAISLPPEFVQEPIRFDPFFNRPVYASASFSGQGRHPSQCLDWLLSSLDFDAEDDNFSNASDCRGAIGSLYTYKKDMSKHSLTFSVEEKVLAARLEMLDDILELMGEGLDWKALRRYLKGSYDDDIAEGKFPFALTKGARYDDED